jgi:tRNA(Ile)-lysidine synthase
MEAPTTAVSNRPGLVAAVPLPAGSRVLAAVSGGPDSTALLFWLLESGVDVVVAHYDHALRGGSPADAEHVASLCERLGVELIRERRRGPCPTGSLQQAARSLRYEFLERARRATGCDLVALGHTADDVVEGVLLHLLRGSGLAGLRGMPERRGPYVRPLLAVWRTDVEDFLRSRGIAALHDPANDDTGRFARARVRHQLLPALERDRPGLSRRIWGAALAARRLQAILEAAAARLAGDRAALAQASRPVRLEAYRQLYGRQPALDRRHLEAMDRLALGGRAGAGLDLPGGLRFRVERTRVAIGPAVEPAPPPPALRARPCPGCDDPHAVHLRAELPLALGHRIPGLRMRPVGAPGTRKLQDILTEARVPRHRRDRLPLVFAGGRLAWVPGIAVDVESAAAPGEPAQHVWLEPAAGDAVPESAIRAYQEL